MAKVTSKLQVTIPKAVADEYGIGPGDEIDFVPAGDAIRVVVTRDSSVGVSRVRRLELFEAASVRQRERDQVRSKHPSTRTRGWTREELYERGRTD